MFKIKTKIASVPLKYQKWNYGLNFAIVNQSILNNQRKNKNYK